MTLAKAILDSYQHVKNCFTKYHYAVDGFFVFLSHTFLDTHVAKHLERNHVLQGTFLQKHNSTFFTDEKRHAHIQIAAEEICYFSSHAFQNAMVSRENFKLAQIL